MKCSYLYLIGPNIFSRFAIQNPCKYVREFKGATGQYISERQRIDFSINLGLTNIRRNRYRHSGNAEVIRDKVDGVIAIGQASLPDSVITDIFTRSTV